MANRKHIKRHLRENPQFANWLKEKPELYDKLKQDPSILDGIIVSWTKEKNKQNQLQKIGQGYRQVVTQIQELNTLIERIDHLMANVKRMNEKWSAYKGQLIPEEPFSEASSKTGRKRKPTKNVNVRNK